uniref:CD209 antigen-like n=1 Tax=Cynoglossus semilaevis TaxID=244447 RepID=A0A3P8W813_CYNSE
DLFSNDTWKFQKSLHETSVSASVFMSVRNNPFKIATICLGILCFLLVAGGIGQSLYCKSFNVTETSFFYFFYVLHKISLDKTCPDSWRKFEYSCYYTSIGKKSWKSSREYCQSKGGDLVIIQSQSEMTFINGLYMDDKEAWIGLSDSGVEGTWRWVDGSPLTHTYWAQGQPNSYNGREQDCVEFWHRATKQGEWNDENCTIEQNWICEM